MSDSSRSRRKPTQAVAVVVLAATALTAAGASGPDGPAPVADRQTPPAQPEPFGVDGGTVPVAASPPQAPALTNSVGSRVPAKAHDAPVGQPVLTEGTTGIPGIVLAAYQRAAARLASTTPGCHLPTELLAGIGKVESGHARGGLVDAAGTSITPILGPLLDGGGFAAISDTDGGLYDGSASWDRAVGPMQFIPSTWRRWAADGNNDSIANPENVFDATLAAGDYLCAGGRDLDTEAGLDSAILSYNNSVAYLNLVRSWMFAYQGAGSVNPDIENVAIVLPGVPAGTPGTVTPPPSTPTKPATPTTPTKPTTPTTPPTSTTNPAPPSTTEPTTPTTPPGTTPSSPDQPNHPSHPTHPTHPAPPPTNVLDPVTGLLICTISDLGSLLGGLLGGGGQPSDCPPDPEDQDGK